MTDSPYAAAIIRLPVVACLLFAAPVVGSAGVFPDGVQPNILLIMADDLGVECLGSYGGESYATPHLDRMAARGLRFTNAFATPLCSTTRVELMTGRSSQRDWIGFGLLNPKARTFGHAFKQAGYRTGIVGKWQLTSYDPPDYPGANLRRNTGMLPGDSGFDDYSLFHTRHTESKGSRYADPTLDMNGSIRTFPDAYGPTVCVERGQEFILEQRNFDQPWLLYYPMILPHWPMVPTPDSPAWKNPGKRYDEDIAYFGDMVRLMDRLVGALIETVERSASTRPTLILFYSDNGTHLSIASKMDQGWKPGGKGLSTDAGTRVPLIAFSPTFVSAGVTDAMVAPTDFYQTLLDVAGISEDTSHLDGVSFAPVLAGSDGESPAGSRKTWTCYYEPRPGWDKDQFTKLVFTRDDRHKLYDDGRFYDVESDTYENRPIPESERTDNQRAIASKLHAAMQADLQEKPLPASR